MVQELTIRGTSELGVHHKKGVQILDRAAGKIKKDAMEALNEFLAEGKALIKFKNNAQKSAGFEPAFLREQSRIEYSFSRAKQYIRVAEQAKLLNKYLKSLEDNNLRGHTCIREDKIEIKEKLPSFVGFLEFVQKEDPREKPINLQTPTLEKFTKKVEKATKMGNDLATLISKIQEEWEDHQWKLDDPFVGFNFGEMVRLLQRAMEGEFTTAERKVIRHEKKEVA